jgi:hypothetical protein
MPFAFIRWFASAWSPIRLLFGRCLQALDDLGVVIRSGSTLQFAARLLAYSARRIIGTNHQHARQ